MKLLRIGLGLAALALVGGAVARPAGADPVVLDFEGVGDLARVLEFYNGGLDSLGNGPGIDYGISFASAARVLVDFDAGGSGNFAFEPSPDSAVYFAGDVDAVVNVPAGFGTGFSVYYTSGPIPGTLDVYDGLDGSGNLLASIALPALGYGPGDPNGDYSNWAPAGAAFAGTARSVSFAGAAGGIMFDDITLGSASPGTGDVPEPGALTALAALGVAGVGVLRRRRRVR